MDVFSAVVEGSRPHLREAALHASDALGLAELLSAGSRSLMEIVRALRLPGSHRLHALLDVLALEGAVDVSAAPDGAPRFSARAPLLAPRGNSLPKAGWGRLAEVIRTGVRLRCARPLPCSSLQRRRGGRARADRAARPRGGRPAARLGQRRRGLLARVARGGQRGVGVPRRSAGCPRARAGRARPAVEPRRAARGRPVAF